MEYNGCKFFDVKPNYRPHNDYITDFNKVRNDHDHGHHHNSDNSLAHCKCLRIDLRWLYPRAELRQGSERRFHVELQYDGGNVRTSRAEQ